MIVFIFIFILQLINKIECTNIFIDPSSIDDSEDGSIEHPFKGWRSFTFVEGNNYYQKCGTEWINNAGYPLLIDKNNVQIGSYYLDSNNNIIIESEDPKFGEFCKNNKEKPILKINGYTTSVARVSGNNVDINSLQFKGGPCTLYLMNMNISLTYSRIGWSYFGVRVGLSNVANNVYIGYNYIFSDKGRDSVDGAVFGKFASNGIMEYNVFDGWNHCSMASTGRNNENNVLRYNAVYSWDDLSNECACWDSPNLSFIYNYCKSAGIVPYQGRNSVVAYNVMDGHSTYGYTGPGQIQLMGMDGLEAVEDSKVYNNLIYDRRDGIEYCGIRLIQNVGNIYGSKRNHFFNNLVLNFNNTKNPPFLIADSAGTIVVDENDPDVNLWSNNLAYGHTHKDYMNIRWQMMENYKDANDFNSRYGAANNNRDDDPMLKNPEKGEFYPIKGGNSVGTGYSECKDCLDQLLDPVLTDLTAHPPKIAFKKQINNKWNIGPFSIYEEENSNPLVDNIIPFVIFSIIILIFSFLSFGLFGIIFFLIIRSRNKKPKFLGSTASESGSELIDVEENEIKINI